MKQAIRIVATVVRDQNWADNDEYKFFCDVVVSHDIIESRKFFGYVDDGGDISPFILCPPMNGLRGSLQWNRNLSENEETTIYTSAVKVGSYFTVDHQTHGEWTYQIKHIVVLV